MVNEHIKLMIDGDISGSPSSPSCIYQAIFYYYMVVLSMHPNWLNTSQYVLLIVNLVWNSSLIQNKFANYNSKSQNMYFSQYCLCKFDEKCDPMPIKDNFWLVFTTLPHTESFPQP